MRRTGTSNKPCCGRPVEVCTSEIVEKIRQIVLEEHRLKLFVIAETIKISNDVQVLTNILGLYRLAPHLLSSEKMLQGKTFSSKNLERYHKKAKEFLRWLIKMDEIFDSLLHSLKQIIVKTVD